MDQPKDTDADPVPHSPGPWTHCEQMGRRGHCLTAQVFDAAGDSLAVIETTDDERLASANARLMAAAPELLDACKAAVELLEHPEQFVDCQPAYGLLRGAISSAGQRR